MIDFPQNPTVGQQFTAAGVTWTWDGTKWTAGGQSVAYLPLAGGTMLGPIVLAADPAAALQPATKQYVDGGRLGDNRLINGDMRIDQRNNGASGTAISVYTVDRWAYGATQAAKGTWQRGGAAVGFGASLSFQSSSAYTPLASDTFTFFQPIEADAIADFQWGTANAQPVTLSFLALTGVLTGTFSGSLSNTTRSYPFTFSIPTVNTWTRIVVTVPGDTAGTWTLSGNAMGVRVIFDLGSGATLRAPAGVWAAGAYNGANGAQNIVSTNGAGLWITGVKLEIGSVATPFNRQSLAKSMADCQRYYQTGNWGLGGYSTVGVANYTQSPLPVLMRATPTVTYTLNTPGNISTASPTVVGAATLAINATVSANGGFSANGTYTLSAEL